MTRETESGDPNFETNKKSIVGEIPSDISLVDEEVQNFETLLATYIWNDELQNLSLAFREALDNAIVHGNKSDSEKMVHYEITISPKEVRVLVRDHGSGFDRSKIPDPTHPDNLLRPSGRGLTLFIEQAFPDHHEYNQTTRGFEVNLKKTRD